MAGSVNNHYRAGGGMKLERGFTLTELLIVTAVVGILALIAYPSYAAYLTKARRAEAQMALLTLMQQQEQYYTHHHAYLPFGAEASEPEARRFRWWMGESAASSAYELSGHECPEQPLQRCIELRATPGTSRVNSRFRDRDCETLSMTSTGGQTASGPMARCWP